MIWILIKLTSFTQRSAQLRKINNIYVWFIFSTINHPYPVRRCSNNMLELTWAPNQILIFISILHPHQQCVSFMRQFGSKETWKRRKSSCYNSSVMKFFNQTFENSRSDHKLNLRQSQHGKIKICSIACCSH